jgi:hypothetical protein
VKCFRHQTLANIGEVGNRIFFLHYLKQVLKKVTSMNKVEIVYVVSKSGKPLMPTKRLGKVRRLLKSGKAKVFRYEPFTIQLLYETTEYTQEVTLGVDAGYQTIGFSATTETQELIAGELELLSGMSERLKERAMYRNNRRSRTRYRPPRFDNRRRPKGWLAPSIQHKLDSHIRLVDVLTSILPITKIIVEVASFDIQAIKNPNISGVGYQQGEQAGFWNLREYILHRDGHKCQNPKCKNRAKEQILEVHHLGYWKKDKSDRPSNLITLCTKCHSPKNHLPKGLLYGWQPAVKSFKPETFMTTVRWRLTNELSATHTYGYITKSGRIALNLEKTHYNDAFVIAGGTAHKRATPIFMGQKRRNNRKLETFVDAKYIDKRTVGLGKKPKTASGQELSSGRRKRNKNLNGPNLRVYRGKKVRKGKRRIRRKRYPLQPLDVVKFQGEKYVVKGTHSYGRRVKLKFQDYDVFDASVSKVTSIQMKSGIYIK